MSEDLTRNQDRDKLPILGMAPDKDTLSRHDGQETFGQIVTLTESPLKEGLLYAGSDDGNVQVSRDAGKTWKSLTGKVRGVPEGTYVSRVVASRFAEGTAYVTFDGHRSDDYNAYVFMTTDFGENWKSLKNNLPAGVTCRVIREHPRSQNLLFLGTEFGAFVSFDRGEKWIRLRGNLPMVRVDDIQIHPRDNDLVLATHGRSIWVLDDIAPLEQLSDNVVASEFHLFDVRPTTQYRLYPRKGNTGHKDFAALNPFYGAVITYYLKAKPKEDVKIVVTGRDGKVVREITGPKEAGINRIGWDSRWNRAAGAQPGQTTGMFGGPPGPRVPPGEYTIKVTASGKEAIKTVRVEEDPRIQISEADRARWNDATMKAYELQKTADSAQRSVQNLKTQLTALQESLKKNTNVPQPITAAAKAVADQIDDIQRRLVPVFDQSGNAGPPLPDAPRPLIRRLGQLAGAFESYTAAPTADQTAAIEELSRELKSLIDQLNRVIEEAVPNLNKQMRDSGVPFVSPGPRVSQQ
jgi:hypothetical protein